MEFHGRSQMNTLQSIKLGYSPLHPGLAHSGYAIFIHDHALVFLNGAVQENYPGLKLIKKIVAMRSNPRPWDAGVKKGTTELRQLSIDGVWVNYFISNGVVYIYWINQQHNTNPHNAHLCLIQNSKQIKQATRYSPTDKQNTDGKRIALSTSRVVKNMIRQVA